jgi:two-component system, cell cycle sensor histidine kinase and response regulator CckA
MALSLSQRLSMRDKGLRYHLLIVEFVVIVIPLLSLFYIFYREHFFLETSQMVIVALTLVLILTGLIILRQIFDRFSLLAISLQEAKKGEKVVIHVQRDTVELHEITRSFNDLMSRLEETTAELRQSTLTLLNIRELTEVVRKSLDIDELLTMLLEKSMDVTKAQIGSVLMAESDRNRFRVVAARGTGPGSGKNSSINIHDTLLEYVVSKRRSLLVQDIETDPRTRGVNDPKYGAPSFLSMPIFAGESLLGILNLSCKEMQQVFDSHDEDIVSIMVGEIGFALDNARLHSQALEHVTDLQDRTGELTKANERLEEQIAERKRIEQHLEDTNKFLHNILDSSSSISIISTDLEQNILFWNKGAENIFGYSAEEIVGKHTIEVLYPDEEIKQQVGEVRSLITKEKINTHKELREITKDGRILWVNLNLTPRFDERGSVIGILGIGEDVTEHRKRDEDLRRSEEKYRTILETIEEGYFEVDLAGKFTFFNDALCRISGSPREEVTGMIPRDYSTPETEKRMSRIFNEIYRTGKPSKVTDYEIIKGDGSRIILEMSTSLMRDSSGHPIGFRGVVRDVTQRKRAEEEQRKLEAQLHYAQRMEALGTLAGGIAHNFNNLLMGIMGNTSLLLLETESESPNYEKLKKIEKLIDSGALLTKQLLGYVREGHYEIKTIHMNRVVKELSDIFAMTKKNITVHQELNEKLYAVKADQGQIEQVLWNLYVNAADAMPTGGELFLRTKNGTDEEMTGRPYDVKPGNYVLVTVRDTGVGMDEKTMDHIFEPFFTTKGLSKGTGLGLSSVYGMVKAHGGYIEVESKTGEGTTFNIYLPASQEEIKEEKVLTGEMRGGTETILLVDDEEQILEVSKEMLKVLGYTVHTANSGKKALAIYREHKDDIDMVILDMIMPDLSGGETYDQLKQINPHVKVLLSSGYSRDSQASEILDRGCDRFIQKPFDIKELSRNLRHILAHDPENPL